MNIHDHDDDQPVGRVLTRREVLTLLGGAGIALVGCNVVQGLTDTTASGGAANTVSLPACVVRPEMTEGPYFVDQMLNRSDIRTDPVDGSVKEGVPLRLVFRVSQISASACVPLSGAQVDVWHCDALGVYSGVQDRSFDTTGSQFLRGYQLTDANGSAEFLTIYPGWYQGRAVHIHFKIRTSPADNQSYDFTSQLFFDDALNNQVFTQAPYSSKGLLTMRNSDDGIFQSSGDQLLLQPAQDTDGYTAIFDIGLQIA
jgi:protocatechuate 3,4-dioxygenase beta subunit